MVKFSSACLLALTSTTHAFVVPRGKTLKRTFLHSTAMSDADFFDQVTSEGGEFRSNNNKRVVLMPAASSQVVVKSMSAVMEEQEVDTEIGGEYEEEAEGEELVDNEFSELERQMQIEDFRQQYGLTKRKKTAKVQRQGPRQVSDYVWDFAVPVLGSAFVLSTAATTLTKKYKDQQKDTMASYTNEMIYHDGDFEEMKMCQNAYRAKLGPGPKRKKMLTAYLEAYSKKKVVSPKAISSLSYVFSLYKMSEQDAAKILVKAAENLSSQPASRSKLLFFGEHILKSPEALKELQPIRDMLASAYRSGGPAIVANAQKTIGQAAYKNAVIAGGSEQTKLTLGWDLLGLTKEEAENIFEQCREDGFESDAKKLYGQPLQKYDEKGRKIDESGKLMKGEEEDDDSAANGPTGSIFECSECGFTLFPAKGREFKFFPADFKCPECGAAKDKFVGRN